MSKDDSFFKLASAMRSLIRDRDLAEESFNRAALDLFAFQFANVEVVRSMARSRGVDPGSIDHWTEVSALPISAFKDFEVTVLAPCERTGLFRSSGTTRDSRSSHFHNAHSLAVYEDSLREAFRREVAPMIPENASVVSLTPEATAVPDSSLVHMFGVLAERIAPECSVFLGEVDGGGNWRLDVDGVPAWLGGGASDRGERGCPRPQCSVPSRDTLATSASSGTGVRSKGFGPTREGAGRSARGRARSPSAIEPSVVKAFAESGRPVVLLGTAFSFVHLCDGMREPLVLPSGSLVLETGGYKGRSRELEKTALHALIGTSLGVPDDRILCEYGMCELSSQAYDVTDRTLAPDERAFRFPDWVRVRIVSPETGREVAIGETGLIQIFDLANVASCFAIQTEDLGERTERGFRLAGRATDAVAKGCSLMTQS